VGTVGIVPVKRFAAAKQRLAEAVNGADRAVLARTMLADSLASLMQCHQLDHLLVVTGEDEAANLAASVDVEVVPGGPDVGQSRAAAAGIARASAQGASRVALLPADCPLVDPQEVDDLILTTRAPVVVVPDRHGTGTNALLLRPPGAIAPAFGEGSRDRHVALARAAGHEPAVVEVESLGLDLDTPEDLEALRQALESHPGRAPATREALG
jgi:2-phospho-L-lactate/phosphoenolpyruvate guanylyltransferase